MASVTFNFFLNETAKEDSTRLVLMRITYQRKHKYIGTGVYVREKHFNPEGTYDKENWVRKAFGEVEAVATQNGILKAWIDRGNKVKQHLTGIGQHFTVDDVKQRLEQTSGDSLAAFIRETVAFFRSRKQNGHATNHEATLNALLECMGLDKQTGEFTIYQLSAHVVEKFETYLLTRKIRRKSSTDASRRNSANEHLRRLHHHIRNFLVKHKLPDELDPLRGRIFKVAPTKRVQLNDAELIKWMDAKLPTGTKAERTINDSRNLYLCSYFLHGLRARDLIVARVSQLVQEWDLKDGQLVRRYRFLTTAMKTDKTKAIQVEDEILPILLAYAEGKEPDEFLFPFLKSHIRHLSQEEIEDKAKNQNVYVDGKLKVIAAQLGINKPVAMHSARHTFAEMLMEETGDVRLLQVSLGHSEISTTERYFSRGAKQSFTDKANSLYRRQAQNRPVAEEENQPDSV